MGALCFLTRIFEKDPQPPVTLPSHTTGSADLHHSPAAASPAPGRLPLPTALLQPGRHIWSSCGHFSVLLWQPAHTGTCPVLVVSSPHILLLASLLSCQPAVPAVPRGHLCLSISYERSWAAGLCQLPRAAATRPRR